MLDGRAAAGTQPEAPPGPADSWAEPPAAPGPAPAPAPKGTAKPAAKGADFDDDIPF
jgi:hypothetical protein